MGLMSDFTKFRNNSKSPKVFPYTWQMRPQALTKPLLNQQIGRGKNAVTKVWSRDGTPECVSRS